MIVTVTPNPSIDRTVTVPTELDRGAVHRVTSVTNEPGGKGINVARALTLADVPTVAVLPAGEHDPILAGLRAQGVDVHPVPVASPVRTNVAITEPDGTTTKINEPGAPLAPADAEALSDAVLSLASPGNWMVLSGSLPPGLPDGWYSDMTEALKARGARVAVDTSDAPLTALARRLERAAPDLIKPNAEELASLVGAAAESLENAAARGDAEPVVRAARQLIGRGVGAVLATLGAAGAVLVDADGAWLARPAPITPRSTVGAGDSALAGYLRADLAGDDAPGRLRMAVAYGSAAAALPGSALPTPDDVNLADVVVTPAGICKEATDTDPERQP